MTFWRPGPRHRACRREAIDALTAWEPHLSKRSYGILSNGRTSSASRACGSPIEALERGGVAPAVLSAANEVAVAAFVEEKIEFGAIAQLVEATLERVPQRELTLDAVRDADREARAAAAEFVGDYQFC